MSPKVIRVDGGLIDDLVILLMAEMKDGDQPTPADIVKRIIKERDELKTACEHYIKAVADSNDKECGNAYWLMKWAIEGRTPTADKPSTLRSQST